MQSFKQFLKEESTPQFITDVEEVRKFCLKRFSSSTQYSINEDGSIIVYYQEFKIEETGNEYKSWFNRETGHLAVKIDQVANNLTITTSQDTSLIVKSLHGCPKDVMGNFTISSPTIQSLKGGPKVVGHLYTIVNFESLKSYEGIAQRAGAFVFYSRVIKSFANLNKLVKYIKFSININSSTITSNVLSLLKIDGNFQVQSATGDDEQWATIVNKHLEKPLNERDILQCQEELIEAGLKDYAKF